MTGFGASFSLPHLPAKVSSLNAERPLSLGGANWPSCPRACEKVIATNEQAILCHWVGLRQYEEFGRAALDAIELLVLVRVRSSHTASPHSGPWPMPPVSLAQLRESRAEIHGTANARRL